MATLLRHRFKLLLGGLVVLLLVGPVIFQLLLDVFPVAAGFLLLIVAMFTLLVGTLAVSDTPRKRAISLVLLVLSLVVDGAVALGWHDEVAICHHCLRILIIGFVMAAVLWELFQPAVVTFETVCSSLCVYLMIGAVWANLFDLLEILEPGSIITSARVSADSRSGLNNDVARTMRMLYFSFVTLSSVGYGDVVPATTAARMFAVTEAIVGQMYLLVMVSRLVGLHASQATPAPTTPPPDNPPRG
jgi:hypothetical protein